MTTNTGTTTILLPAAGVTNPIVLDAFKQATSTRTAGMSMDLVDMLLALGLTGAAWKAQALGNRIDDLQDAIDSRAAALDECSEEAHQEGRTPGHDDGCDDGYLEGYEDGHSDGYAEGYDEGYDDGYAARGRTAA